LTPEKRDKSRIFADSQAFFVKTFINQLFDRNLPRLPSQDSLFQFFCASTLANAGGSLVDSAYPKRYPTLCGGNGERTWLEPLSSLPEGRSRRSPFPCFVPHETASCNNAIVGFENFPDCRFLVRDFIDECFFAQVHAAVGGVSNECMSIGQYAATRGPSA
jgi:hypothetical protein